MVVSLEEGIIWHLDSYLKAGDLPPRTTGILMAVRDVTNLLKIDKIVHIIC